MVDGYTAEPFCYFWTGGIFYVGKLTENEEHLHHAMQITIGLDGEFQFSKDGTWHHYRGIVIDANKTHQIKSGKHWVATIMLNAEYLPVKVLKQQLLEDSDCFELSEESVSNLLNNLPVPTHAYDDCFFASELIKYTLINLIDRDKSGVASVDSRLTRLLEYISALEVKKISTKMLAQQIHVSETRLIHMFKAYTGIPVRRYLRWLRLDDALRLISDGMSFTDAAHHAGFSDAAHLSRTTRATLGISLSMLFHNKRIRRIQSCTNEKDFISLFN